jgi:hypothetical protein
MMTQSTQISVTIHIDSDRESELVTLLTMLCQLLLSFWQVGQAISQFGYEVVILASDIKEAVTFYGQVFRIGFASLVFGMGVRL